MFVLRKALRKESCEETWQKEEEEEDKSQN